MSDEETGAKRLRSNTTMKLSTTTASNDMSVSELAKLMKSQLATNQRSTRDDINKLGDKLTMQMEMLKVELTTDIEKIREENKVRYDELSTVIEHTKTETAHLMERSQRSNDLIVNGVPFVQGENLLCYFQAWCQSLGYPVDFYPHVDLRRLSKGPAVAGSVYTILIQFAITVQRNDFYSRYLKSRSLALTDIGFTVNKRIYVNENLGPAARELRTKALLMKKDGKLRGVFTKNGVVYIKRAEDDRETAVTSKDHLDRIVN